MMTALSGVALTEVVEKLREVEADGWLLYDFRGTNPVARRVIGDNGMGTRRLFVFLPGDGRSPIAIAHRIELQALHDFPGEVRPYASWQELHTELERVVRGKRIAMEVSPLDAVPYLDRVPYGVVRLLESLGASIQSSADLVTHFAARLNETEMDDHVAAAEVIADIARSALADVVARAGEARELDVQHRILEAIEAAGLVTSHPPIVAFGAHAANPHYEPGPTPDVVLRPNDVILVDLWAARSRASVYADQTWMGFAGPTPPDEILRVWSAVRDARMAVVQRLKTAHSAGTPLTGADLDDEARRVIVARGFGDAFVHRTGHSIDFELHGSGPHLDNFETNDVRTLVAGIAFSVEPGVYLEGRFGMRSEMNVLMRTSGPHPTPVERQFDLILPA